MTAAIYVLLVGVTIVLQYFAQLMKDSPLYYKVLELLEYGIFLCGTGIVTLVLIYVTVITATDLVQSFREVVVTRLPVPSSTPQAPSGPSNPPLQPTGSASV